MKSLNFIAIVLVVVIVKETYAQVPFLKECPHKDVVQNFNASAYLGKWYEQERFFAIFQLGGSCVTATYTDEGNGVVGVNNEQTYLSTRQKSNIKGTAKLAADTGDAKLLVNFASVGSFQAPYWVLDTDYTSYAIVWSCTNIFSQVHTEFSWVLTREKNPSEEVLSKIKASLEKNGLAGGPYIKTKQVCDN